MNEATEVTHVESRWEVVLVILAIFLLLILLPGRVKVFPYWIPLILTIALIVPMVALQLPTPKARWLRVEGIVILFFLVITRSALVGSLGYLLFEMVRRSFEVTGIQLLASSVAAWATNVLLFSLVYWRLDRGGPEARTNHVNNQSKTTCQNLDFPSKIPGRALNSNRTFMRPNPVNKGPDQFRDRN